MQLPGRLRSTTLGDLLGGLHRARATGVLELIEAAGAWAGRSHRIHLEGGLVSRVETQLETLRLGELLLEQGLVVQESVRRLLRRMTEAPSRRSGELLVEDGLSRELVGAALRRQLRLRVDALFRLLDAEVRFHVARRPEPAERAVPLSPREFLHGRRRKRDAEPARASPRVPRAAPAPGRDRARARALAVLGLDAKADREAVQRTFRTLARDVHPDRHPRADAHEKARLLQRFAELSAAYHLLVA